ncbi:FtsX-like permease family protein [Haloglycomyces albus]|uniref:FtsX-like permease family protein n=1 Tax=Haloglycomyces albus TaxID=526067 RepID=UPI00046CA8E1|nr:FtsX-like permease family protein [Haloglycomyces albus]
MRATLGVAWTLFRSGRSNSRLSSVLTLAAIAVVTLVLLFTVAANLAFAQRADATAWRSPAEVSSDEAIAHIATATDFVDATLVKRVDVAAEDSGSTPPPPGLDRFPRPGEVFASPAAQELLESRPDAQLADRYGEITGTIAKEALTGPGEVLVVIGHTPDSDVMTLPRDGGSDDSGPYGFASFSDGSKSDIYLIYQNLMALATVFMLVPLFIFGAAAARLNVARKDHRLASMRLIGATPRQVTAITVVETTLIAFLGAVLGAVTWVAAIPLVRHIPIDGTAWYASDLWSGIAPLLLTVTVVPILVAVSAIVGLRRVLVSPLGVVQRQKAPGLRAIRLLVFLGLLAAFFVGINLVNPESMAGTVIVFSLMAAFVWGLSFLGPWVIQTLGRIVGFFARSPARLLAARRMATDPKSAWRTVSGVTLIGFIAGYIAMMPMMTEPARDLDEPRLSVTTSMAAAEEAAASLESSESVAARDIEVIESEDGDGARLSATFDSLPVDEARTVMASLIPGSSPQTDSDFQIESSRSGASIATGVLVVLVVSFMTAIISAAIAGVASTLEKREVYHLMHLAGMPRKVLNRARRQETLMPLTVLGGGSILTGVLIAVPFLNLAPEGDSMAWILAVAVAVGFIGVMLANAVARPVLSQAMYTATVQGD